MLILLLLSLHDVVPTKASQAEHSLVLGIACGCNVNVEPNWTACLNLLVDVLVVDSVHKLHQMSTA